MPIAKAYPSSPARPPVEHFYYRVYDKDGEEVHFSTQAFAAVYAAHITLKTIMAQASKTKIKKNLIILKHKGYKLTITGSRLNDALNYKPNKEEALWTPMISQKVMNFWITSSNSQTEGPKEKPTPSKPKTSTPRPRKTKPVKTGYISVADMANLLSLTPNKARTILRKAKIAKPEHGWSFKSNSPEYKKVMKVLSESS